MSCLALAFLAAAGIARAQETPPTLSDKTFEQWRDFIHPKGEQLEWQRIGWHTTLWSGLTAAQEQKKPFLVWIMNGHPCGLT